MPNTKYPNLHTPTSVERACEITKSLFNAARGQHATDAETVHTIARRAQLSPAAVRKFLQPSRAPKDVSLGVWSKLLGAYRRYLEHQLAALQAEIARLDHLDPDDRRIRALLHEAQALVRKVELASQALPAAGRDAE